MFESLSNKIVGIFDKLKNSGTLTEKNIEEALREIRIALLSADVSLPIAKKFIEEVKQEAIGSEVFKSLSPNQTVIKIVREKLTSILGSDNNKIDFSKTPTKIMLVGLQGAGKTTTAGKLAALFQKKYPNKSVSLCSVDIYRPAAIEQLRVISEKIHADFYEIDLTKSLVQNTQNFLKNAITSDLLLLDTAGRLQIDDEKMDELVQLKAEFKPDEILLVADITTGQEAINIAKKYNELLDISGIILTRVDGDAKGGVALSMREATGVQIKYIGVGEALDKLEEFSPSRIADRILDMGDVFALIEKAQETFQTGELEESTSKMFDGSYSLDDFSESLKKMNKMGGLSGMMKFLPQYNKLAAIAQSQGIQDNITHKNIAIISSMTKKERKNIALLNASRKKRIAAGSGTTVQEVNRLIKQFTAMKSTFKIMKKMSANKGGMAQLLSSFKGFRK